MFEPGDAVGPADLLAESSAIGVDRSHRRDPAGPPRPVRPEGRRRPPARPADDALADADARRHGEPRVVHAVGLPGDGGAPLRAPDGGSRRTATSASSRSTSRTRPRSSTSSPASPTCCPDDGLIIDVRGNGGGLIYAAEQLLQLLTPEADRAAAGAVRQHRRSTCASAASTAGRRRVSGLVLEPWIESIEQATRTAATFSRGFPITSPIDANRTGSALPRARSSSSPTR